MGYDTLAAQVVVAKQLENMMYQKYGKYHVM